MSYTNTIQFQGAIPAGLMPGLRRLEVKTSATSCSFFRTDFPELETIKGVRIIDGISFTFTSHFAAAALDFIALCGVFGMSGTLFYRSHEGQPVFGCIRLDNGVASVRTISLDELKSELKFSPKKGWSHPSGQVFSDLESAARRLLSLGIADGWADTLNCDREVYAKVYNAFILNTQDSRS